MLRLNLHALECGMPDVLQIPDCIRLGPELLKLRFFCQAVTSCSRPSAASCKVITIIIIILIIIPNLTARGGFPGNKETTKLRPCS